ncbi:MAG: hypothetical protein AAGB34_04290 [Planctomycetota bacterium]
METSTMIKAFAAAAAVVSLAGFASAQSSYLSLWSGSVTIEGGTLNDPGDGPSDFFGTENSFVAVGALKNNDVITVTPVGFNGGSTGFSFDTVAAQTSILNAEGVLFAANELSSDPFAEGFVSAALLADIYHTGTLTADLLAVVTDGTDNGVDDITSGVEEVRGGAGDLVLDGTLQIFTISEAAGNGQTRTRIFVGSGIPTPGAAALAGLAGIAGLRRRRA